MSLRYEGFTHDFQKLKTPCQYSFLFQSYVKLHERTIRYICDVIWETHHMSQKVKLQNKGNYM